MKTYLVTGAAGFIGSKLAALLLKNGSEVVVVDNLTTGKSENVPEKATFIAGDCQDSTIIDQLRKYQFEAVFHIAGQSSGEISFDDPVYDLQTNAQSTLQLLKLCQDTGCRKMIYASSMSVYGDVDQMPVAEKTTPVPKSFYGVGKLASEHYLRIYGELGISTASLRLFNVYGPGQNLENMRQGMVSIFLSQALNDGQILVKGSADRFRDFVFIDDVVNAFVLVEQNLEEKSNLLLNICTNKKTTVGELVDCLIKKFNRKISVQYSGSTPGDQFGIIGSFDQALKTINWKPKTPLEKGIGLTVDFIKKEMECE